MAVASGTPATRELRLLYFVGVDPEALGDPPRSKIRFRRCDLPAKRSGLPCRDEGAHLPAFAFGAGIGDVVDGWAWAPNVVAFATNVRTMGFSEGDGPRGGFQRRGLPFERWKNGFCSRRNCDRTTLWNNRCYLTRRVSECSKDSSSRQSS